MEQSVQSCCPSSAKGQRDLLHIPLSYPQKQSQIATCRFGNLLFNSQKIFKYHTHRLTYPPTFQSFNLSLSLSFSLSVFAAFSKKETFSFTLSWASSSSPPILPNPQSQPSNGLALSLPYGSKLSQATTTPSQTTPMP